MDSSLNFSAQLPALNLPQFDPLLKKDGDQLFIFDPLRKKYLVLTPEEWVRQNWVNFLVHHLDYPKGLVSVEKGVKYNKLQKRTDLIVLDSSGKPYLLLECKAPSISITKVTLNQAMVYFKEIGAPNIILTNGIKHFCLEFSKDEKKFVQRDRLPLFPKS